MTDKTLTDSEIIKALKLFIERIKNSKFDFTDKCNLIVFENALDLINRQKEENKRLSTLAELGNTRANDYRVMRDRALKAEAENERLKDISDNKTKELLRYNASIEELHKKLETAKDEAYKEFAEVIFELFPNDKPNTVISRVTVKHILKDLVG